MPQNYTDTQKLAIDSNARDICVSAGAGSGKTGVLVERFLRIVTQSISGVLPLSERATVSDILVVTFTDRATREMKSRIVRALNERGLTEERRQLETAYISTIHGLCSRLLKENPFEAGVDPGFTVLDEAEAQRMIREAFDRVIANGYQSNDSDVTSLVDDVISGPTFNGSDLDAPPILAFEVETIMSKLRGAGVTIEELQQIWQTGTCSSTEIDPVQALLQPTFLELAACVDDLRRLAAACEGSVHAAIASVLNVVGRMHPSNEPITQVRNVKAMSDAATKALTLPGSEHPDGLQLLLNRIKSACGSVSELYGISVEVEASSKIRCRRFTGLICKIWSLYASEKQQSGILDNEDLLTTCVRLLDSSAEVRHRYQRQFRHLMIDEFQDTNSLQVRLLELLHARRLNHSIRHLSPIEDTDVSPNSLFIVGDLQQSIYGFRNADPDLFCSIECQFREEATGLHVQMVDNFRSRPEILRLAQRIFEVAWRTGPTPFVALQSAAAFDAKSAPSVDMLITNNLARREYIHIEADAIARRLKAMVEHAIDEDEHEEKRVRITALNDPRSGTFAGYGDIAVLLRGLTDVRVYEEAFARHGIPALVTAGGRGYYSRYEIQDLLSVLTLLDSPLDDAALLTALRSPFVGAEVDTIYRLAVIARHTTSGAGSSRERGPFYPALPHLLASPDLPEAEREKIAPFLAALQVLTPYVDRIPVGRLIERLIVQTNYDMRLVCRPGGRRRLANVRKLVQAAHREPGLTVCDFVTRMQDMRAFSDREGDAPTAEEGAGVVRLMTIHAAKGLEFPIVVLPDLSRGLVAPETGLYTCDPVSRVIGSRMGGEPDASYRAITQRRQEADRHEYLRLLYVAITRAREHLILCGNVGRNRGFNWADVVFPALGIVTAPPRPTRLALNGGVEAMAYPFSAVAAQEALQP